MDKKIWEYKDNVRIKEAIRYAISVQQCVFCQVKLQIVFSKGRLRMPGRSVYTEAFNHWHTEPEGDRTVRCCPQCGWWTVKEEVKTLYSGYLMETLVYGATGSLLELDLKDYSVPLTEIRGFLNKNYDARFKIDPFKFEHVVADIYKQLGYQVRVTARSIDGGIDIILDGPSNETIGVQVKRSKNKITVEQLRSFAGALYIKGMTRGIFVTSSSFTEISKKNSELAALKGIPIELVDSKRFYDILGLAQRNLFESLCDPAAAYTSTSLFKIDEQHSSSE